MDKSVHQCYLLLNRILERFAICSGVIAANSRLRISVLILATFLRATLISFGFASP